MLFDLTCKPLKLPLFYVPISDDRPRVTRVDILHPILQTSLVLNNSFRLFQMMLLKYQYVIQG